MLREAALEALYCPVLLPRVPEGKGMKSSCPCARVREWTSPRAGSPRAGAPRAGALHEASSSSASTRSQLAQATIAHRGSWPWAGAASGSRVDPEPKLQADAREVELKSGP